MISWDDKVENEVKVKDKNKVEIKVDKDDRVLYFIIKN